VTGARKARIMREVLQEPPDPLRRPAQGVRPGPGRILWLVDAAAASELLPSQ
jgi:6-phosphogluconolactonase